MCFYGKMSYILIFTINFIIDVIYEDIVTLGGLFSIIYNYDFGEIFKKF